MRVDTMPKKITAEGLQHGIFTGTKYCFVYFDNQTDLSWDGEKDIIDFKDKAISVLWDKEELANFRPNDTVHKFLLSLKEEKENEIKRLLNSKQSKKYKDRKTGEIINLRERDHERAEFLKNNDVIFFEIKFTAESN